MKAPDRCFLQWHGDVTEDEAREYDEDPDWKPDDGEATWCQDRVFDADVEYVRADLLAERDAEIEMLRAYKERNAGANRCACMFDENDNAVNECSHHASIRRELAAERQRARLPEELVSRIKTASDFDLNELRNGAVVPRLLKDILAWHEAAVEQKP